MPEENLGRSLRKKLLRNTIFFGFRWQKRFIRSFDATLAIQSRSAARNTLAPHSASKT